MRICAAPPGLKAAGAGGGGGGPGALSGKGGGTSIAPDESILAAPSGYHEVTVGDLLFGMDVMQSLVSESKP